MLRVTLALFAVAFFLTSLLSCSPSQPEEAPAPVAASTTTSSVIDKYQGLSYPEKDQIQVADAFITAVIAGDVATLHRVVISPQTVQVPRFARYEILREGQGGIDRGTLKVFLDQQNEIKSLKLKYLETQKASKEARAQAGEQSEHDIDVERIDFEQLVADMAAQKQSYDDKYSVFYDKYPNYAIALNAFPECDPLPQELVELYLAEADPETPIVYQDYIFIMNISGNSRGDTQLTKKYRLRLARFLVKDNVYFSSWKVIEFIPLDK